MVKRDCRIAINRPVVNNIWMWIPKNFILDGPLNSVTGQNERYRHTISANNFRMKRTNFMNGGRMGVGPHLQQGAHRVDQKMTQSQTLKRNVVCCWNLAGWWGGPNSNQVHSRLARKWESRWYDRILFNGWPWEIQFRRGAYRIGDPAVRRRVSGIGCHSFSWRRRNSQRFSSWY